MQTTLDVAPVTASLRFFVAGTPQSAGSKTVVPVIKNGHVVARNVVESGNRAAKKAWRSDLRTAAELAVREQGWLIPDPSAGLALTITVVKRRTNEHLGTGRNAGVVKPWALRLRPTTMPDTTKLVRSIEDAFKALVWHDDAAVVEQHADKVFGDQAGGSVYDEGAIVEVALAGPYEGTLLPDVRG